MYVHVYTAYAHFACCIQIYLCKFTNFENQFMKLEHGV